MESSAPSRAGSVRAFTIGAMVLICLAALLVVSRGTPGSPQSDPLTSDASGHLAPEPMGQVTELAEPSVAQRSEERSRADSINRPDELATPLKRGEAEPVRPPAGCIEVIALEDVVSELVGSACAVKILVRTKGRPPFDPNQTESSAVLGVDRKASICDLELGYYMAWIHDHNGASYGTVASVGSESGSRVSVRLGGASLQGRVLDDDQRLSSGACVRVRTTSGGSQVMETRTDERGMYTLPRLVAGALEVEVYLPGLPYHKPSYTRAIELSPDSDAIEDFEPDVGSGIVSGMVRGPSGRAVLGTEAKGAKVVFVCRETQERVPATVAKSGAYRAVVDSGEYAVWVAPPGHSTPQLVERALRVDAVGLRVDLTITGSVIVGTAYESDRVTPRPSDDKGLGSSVRFYRQDRSWEMMFVPVIEGGHYQIHGLSAGTWLVAIGQDSLESDLEIRITEGDVRRELDLFKEQ